MHQSISKDGRILLLLNRLKPPRTKVRLHSIGYCRVMHPIQQIPHQYWYSLKEKAHLIRILLFKMGVSGAAGITCGDP
jgi:hypothetical protein